MEELTIVQRGDPVTAAVGPKGLLFECAQDSHPRRGNGNILPIEQLIGDFDSVKRQAFVLAMTLLRSEPPMRGVAQLRIFEEGVIRELQYTFHVLHLAQRLKVKGVRICRFTKATRISQGLVELNRIADYDLQIRVSDAAKYSPMARSVRNSWRRLVQSRFSGERVRDELGQAFDRFDPFHRRSVRFRRSAGVRGGLWFYSTAYTFTQIGLLYEPYFPEAFQFLIDNAATGGRALREAQRPWISCYEYVSSAMAPTRREARGAADALIQHIQSVPLNDEDELATAMFLQSPFFRIFVERLLPRGLFHTSLFERWIETARPGAVVVGNPVFEGYALHAARRQGIPTLLLQHGILGDFCQFIDPPSDHYVVRGEFWKEFLAPAARERAVVLNPSPADPAVKEICSDARAIVFITTPYRLHEFLDESDLDEILGVVVAAAQETGRELVIRVHPLEQIAYYQERIGELLSKATEKLAVSYSQGPGLDTILRNAVVAVTFSSTVFLDCLRHGVPIISFDWHDFSYKQQIADRGVFYFARGLADLGELIRQALIGKLTPFGQDVDPFLAPTSSGRLRSELAELVRSRSPLY